MGFATYLLALAPFGILAYWGALSLAEIRRLDAGGGGTSLPQEAQRMARRLLLAGALGCVATVAYWTSHM